MKARQERFGIETKEAADEKRLERMKRFGIPVSTEKKAELDAVKAARKERFGSVSESRQRKKQPGFKKRDKKLVLKKKAQSQKQGQQ